MQEAKVGHGGKDKHLLAGECCLFPVHLEDHSWKSDLTASFFAGMKRRKPSLELTVQSGVDSLVKDKIC